MNRQFWTNLDSRKHMLVISALLLLSTVLTACGLFGGSSDTLTVLAGSEVRDLEPLLDEIERETDIRLEFTYIGTLNGAEEIMAGADYDLAWFSHATYLTLLQEDSNLIKTQERIMLSPVVMGVKESKAEQFGWVDNPNVSWEEIAAQAEAGQLRFAMTNPAASNSGFTALMGVAAALSGSSDALQVDDINTEALQGFFRGQTLTAGSSGWLADSYVEEQDSLDAIINYESVLLGLNESGELRERLTLIYPNEGIVTADYPLMLLNEERREAYNRLVEFLRTPDFQEQIMETTLRRPAVAGIALDRRIPDVLLVELPFPSTVDVIDALLFSYMDEQRVPAHAYFVLDVSGSMEGRGLRDLKAAMENLTGLDTSLTGRFARFRNREQITIVTFNHQINDIREFTIDDTDAAGSDMEAIRQYVDSLRADGGTAIYSTLADTYARAARAKEQDRDRYYSIVLMSDGENTDGMGLREFERYFENLHENDQNIRTFTITFGDADEDAMQEIADVTGGRMFDSTEESLSSIFKTIRGYQ